MAEWQNPQIFAIGLAVVLSLVAILVISMIVIVRAYIKRVLAEQERLNKAKSEYQQSLLWNSVLTQEKERERIASELHDQLISKLTVITYALQMESNKIDPIEMLNDSIVLARNITHDLCPPMLQQTLLNELIEDFVMPLSESYQIEYYKDIRKKGDLSNELKLQLLRIVQEVINNILKHAQASRICIHLRLTESSISVLIRDNGVGFDTKTKAKGLGLKNIELRSQLLGSKWRFKSAPQKGTLYQLCMATEGIQH